MPARDLKEKYGRSLSTHAAIKAAIRAELVGGDDAINAGGSLQSLRHAWLKRGWTDNLADIEAATAAVARLRAAMEAEIRHRYGIANDRDAPGR